MAGVSSTVYLSCVILADSSLAAFTIDALKPGYSYTGPTGVDDTNMCKCNTITYSLVSACDACQGADWTRYDPHRCSLRTPWELTFLPLAGRCFRLTAQRLCLPQREFHSRQKLEIYGIGIDEGQMACRFPNPIPSGTRVPRWALLDVTVRCSVLFNRNVFTVPSRPRTIGT
jgi:hypothetical protein